MLATLTDRPFSDPRPHRNTLGETYFEEACVKGWEGLIAKRADGPYVHGRSRDWLKLKCVNRQEFVIGGYTEPRVAEVGFTEWTGDNRLRHPRFFGIRTDKDPAEVVRETAS
jgi:ATP-dependent DNA ligase